MFGKVDRRDSILFLALHLGFAECKPIQFSRFINRWFYYSATVWNNFSPHHCLSRYASLVVIFGDGASAHFGDIRSFFFIIKSRFA